MSSSSTPVKRVASGDGTGDKKRKKVEEYGEKWAGILSDDSDDVQEDADTAAPVDGAVVESIETKTQGFEQAPVAKAKFLKAKTRAIELEKEREQLEKETSDWRSKTFALKSGCRQVDKNMAIVDKIVKENGSDSSKEEADYLENIPNKLIVLTRELNDPVYTLLAQEAFPDRAIPGLRPFRADRKTYAEQEDNEDEPPDGHEADDEDGNFSSDGHEEPEDAAESEEEREYELQREQERGHRAGTSDSGDEHQDAYLAYTGEHQKLSKPAHKRGGPRARDREKVADRDFVVSDQARLEAGSLSPESLEYSGSSDDDDSRDDVPYDESE
ncbi:hypothetical protein KC356_g1946 [Hortaea werneckii]|nr:hypothetical protein KC356_g1946 [Hortaea werneckii]